MFALFTHIRYIYTRVLCQLTLLAMTPPQWRWRIPANTSNRWMWAEYKNIYFLLSISWQIGNVWSSQDTSALSPLWEQNCDPTEGYSGHSNTDKCVTCPVFSTAQWATESWGELDNPLRAVIVITAETPGPGHTRMQECPPESLEGCLKHQRFTASPRRPGGGRQQICLESLKRWWPSCLLRAGPVCQHVGSMSKCPNVCVVKMSHSLAVFWISLATEQIAV